MKPHPMNTFMSPMPGSGRPIPFLMLAWAALLVFPTGLLSQQPTLQPTSSFGGPFTCVAVKGSYAYAGQGSHLCVLDLSDPQHPRKVGSVLTDLEANDLFISGNTLYTAGEDQLRIVDISTPTSPALEGLLSVYNAKKVCVWGNYAYVACETSGLRIADVSNPAAPANANHVAGNVRKVWVMNNLAYIQEGPKHPNPAAFKVYDLADPVNPSLLGSFPEGSQDLDVRDILVQGDYAYQAGKQGLRILDVSNPANILLKGLFETANNWDARIALNGDFLYLINSDPAGDPLTILDVSQPGLPVKAAGKDIPDLIQVVTAPPYGYFLKDAELAVYDLSNPIDPVLESALQTQVMTHNAQVYGAHLFVHDDNQVWVYSLENPSEPTALTSYASAERIQRIFIADNRLYIALFGTLEDKVAIYDAADPAGVNPASPPYLGSYQPQRKIERLFAQGDRLALLTYTTAPGGQASSGEWLELIDLAMAGNNLEATKVGQCALEGEGNALFLNNNIAYVAFEGAQARGVDLIAMANPAAPAKLSSILTPLVPTCLHAAGDTLFIGQSLYSSASGAQWQLEAYNVADPGAPAKLDSTSGPGQIWGLERQENLVFAAIYGGSVYLYDYANQGLTTPLICPSRSTVGITVTPPDLSGQGHVFTPEGLHSGESDYPMNTVSGDKVTDVGSGGRAYEFSYGSKGVNVQTYKKGAPPVGSLITKVIPPEAQAAGCKAEPARVDNVPLGNKVSVKATDVAPWNFVEWTGAASGSTPIAEATVSGPESEAVAHFALPLLTLSGGKAKEVFCPRDPELSENVMMMDLTLSVNDVADWMVYGITFQGYGSHGHEVNDLEEWIPVTLFKDHAFLINEGVYSADDGTIEFIINERIDAGQSLTLQVKYLFRGSSITNPPWPREFWVKAQRDWVNAKPIQPAYANYDKRPQEPVLAGPLVIAPVRNRDTGEEFGSIQAAHDAPDTLENHFIDVCPGKYAENVVVTKSVRIVSKTGPENTVIQARDPNVNVFLIYASHVEIEGFTIEGATGIAPDGRQQSGILVNRAASVFVRYCHLCRNRVGMTFNSSQECVLEKSQVYDNIGVGIAIDGAATKTIIRDSRIEKNHSGVWIGANASRNQVGFLEPGLGAKGNLIQNNLHWGVWIDGNDNAISANSIGQYLRAGQPAGGPNGDGGILIHGNNNRVGKDFYDNILANVISGNGGPGIQIEGRGIAAADLADHNTIVGNFIGVDNLGTTAIPNQQSGIVISKAQWTFIGENRDTGNVISGNALHGIDTSWADNTLIKGNMIGCDLPGQSALPNGKSGIRMEASGGSIGGITGKERNIISGNTRYGIELTAALYDTFIRGNYIGTDVSGTEAVPNWDGIYVTGNRSGKVYIGPLKRSEGANVISGNKDSGIQTYSGGCVIQANYIGCDPSGIHAIPNRVGIQVGYTYAESVKDNIIGGANADEGNVISGNSQTGILLNEPVQKIEGNYIGVGADGKFSLPNQDGIVVQSFALTEIYYDMVIGGSEAGSGNVVACNSRDGVAVVSHTYDIAHGIMILGNSIFANQGLGINLSPETRDGVTLNDAGDPDEGPNHYQNFPLLELAQLYQDQTQVRGSLNSKPGQRFILHYYLNETPDPSGYGQGQTCLGYYTWVQTDATGNASFRVALDQALPLGSYLTATATDAQGSTSEFSPAVQIQDATDQDADGAPDVLEMDAPHNGDANQDGVPDSQQSYVGSMINKNDQAVTVVSPPNTVLNQAQFVNNPSPADAPPDVEFPVGFIEFKVKAPAPGAAQKIEILLPQDVRVNKYYKYGPTPDNPDPHWYEFAHDGQTGATIAPDKIMLDLTDGQRGDDDLEANSTIVDVGAPAYDPSLNSAPVLTVPADLEIGEMTLLLVTNVAADADLPANQLTFALVEAPEGMTIDPASGIISWFPSELQGPGSYAVTVQVNDDAIPSLSDRRTFKITVTEVNRLPEIAPVPDQALDEETTLTIAIQATDPDIPPNPPLLYVLWEGPAGAYLDPWSGLLTWTPSEAQGPGAHPFEIMVTDQDRPTSSRIRFMATVREVNHPPQLAAIQDHTIRLGSTLVCTNDAVDPDLPANPLYYFLLAAPEGAFVHPLNGILTWTPTPAQAGSIHQITVCVLEDTAQKLRDIKSFAVEVLPPERPLSITRIELMSPGSVRLTWTAEAGAVYVVQCKPALAEAAWQVLGEVMANESQTSYTDQFSPAVPQRFYRIQKRAAP